jgi:hypothetical protein
MWSLTEVVLWIIARQKNRDGFAGELEFIDEVMTRRTSK